MRQVLGVLVGLLGLVGCAEPRPWERTEEDANCTIEFAVDSSLERPVTAAAGEWNRYTTCKLVQAPADGAKDQWWILEAKPSTYGNTGDATPAHKLVRIQPGSSEDEAFRIALHEFGHILGIPHQSSGVMCGVDVNPSCPWSGPSALTENDIAACKAIGACE